MNKECCLPADIKMQWGDKKHELNVSTYHMCILLLFNEADRQSYRDILTATNIPAGDLKRALQSLALVKVSQCCLIVPAKGKCAFVFRSYAELLLHDRSGTHC